MICANCGKELGAGAVFCKYCGQQQTTDSMNDMEFCVYCGQELMEGAVFCVHCGKEITQEQRRKRRDRSEPEQPRQPSEPPQILEPPPPPTYPPSPYHPPPRVEPPPLQQPTQIERPPYHPPARVVPPTLQQPTQIERPPVMTAKAPVMDWRPWIAFLAALIALILAILHMISQFNEPGGAQAGPGGGGVFSLIGGSGGGSSAGFDNMFHRQRAAADGEWIYFVHHRDGLYKMKPDGSEIQKIVLDISNLEQTEWEMIAGLDDEFIPDTIGYANGALYLDTFNKNILLDTKTGEVATLPEELSGAYGKAISGEWYVNTSYGGFDNDYNAGIFRYNPDGDSVLEPIMERNDLITGWMILGNDLYYQVLGLGMFQHNIRDGSSELIYPHKDYFGNLSASGHGLYVLFDDAIAQMPEGCRPYMIYRAEKDGSHTPLSPETEKVLIFFVDGGEMYYIVENPDETYALHGMLFDGSLSRRLAVIENSVYEFNGVAGDWVMLGTSYKPDHLINTKTGARVEIPSGWGEPVLTVRGEA
ncbi:MAG: zinc ribbon domain-containing protein [Oscillospiraceae bacterium]|nr:zinc ribbon domain-containing protein [Oscillospiraceae bacterium]